jgi:hypothetical protein
LAMLHPSSHMAGRSPAAGDGRTMAERECGSAYLAPSNERSGGAFRMACNEPSGLGCRTWPLSRSVRGSPRDRLRTRASPSPRGRRSDCRTGARGDRARGGLARGPDGSGRGAPPGSVAWRSAGLGSSVLAHLSRARHTRGIQICFRGQARECDRVAKRTCPLIVVEIGPDVLVVLRASGWLADPTLQATFS